MDVCKGRMEGEQGDVDLGNRLEKCVSGVIQTTLKAREGEERRESTESGLVRVTSGRNEVSLNRNRHFPKCSELGLLSPRQLRACCWFEGQCALKAVPLGTKPTQNIFISIHANILQCFSCLSLVSHTKNSSEAPPWAHAVSNLWQTPFSGDADGCFACQKLRF